MRPLLILIPFAITIVSGRPGSYNYPLPVPSAAPAPSILHLQTLTAPQVYNIPPSPVINLPSPSIAPPLLVENVLGAGQYASSPVNIPPLNIQFAGGQPLGLLHTQIPFSGPDFNFAQQGVNLLPTAVPQLSGEPPELPSIPPQLSLSASTVNPAPFNGGTAVSPSVNLQVPRVHNTEAIIQKHVYVYVAPDDPEEIPPPRQIVIPPPRKNYRIIFIKAPTPPTPKVELIPPQVQTEDKTLVYVLVKKQEGHPEVKIEAPSPTVPSKPEVYFIRYKSQQNVAGEPPLSPTGPLPIENGNENGNIQIVEDLARSNDPTVPTVRIGGTSEQTNVDLNLNKASLDGGSALSLAVSNAPEDTHSLSTPAPQYGPPASH